MVLRDFFFLSKGGFDFFFLKKGRLVLMNGFAVTPCFF